MAKQSISATAYVTTFVTTKNITLSIIIPAYQAERTIERALKSVLPSGVACVHDRLEVIVVDDGSTDNTAAIVSDMHEADERIKLVSQANRGRFIARAAGIKAACGQWVAFLDADDYYLQGAIEAMLRDCGYGESAATAA